jgi:hypothetical protein
MSQRKNDLGIPLPSTWINPSTRPRYGVKDVVTLATLNSAIEDIVEPLTAAGIESLEEQTEFLAQCLEAWLEASGRKEELSPSESLDPNNVVYQGRVLVSALTLLPACVNEIRRAGTPVVSRRAQQRLTRWFHRLMKRAGLLRNGRFISKPDFRKKGYLGSGGIGRFRDTLWAAVGTSSLGRASPEARAELANTHRAKAYSALVSR